MATPGPSERSPRGRLVIALAVSVGAHLLLLLAWLEPVVFPRSMREEPPLDVPLVVEIFSAAPQAAPPLPAPPPPRKAVRRSPKPASEQLATPAPSSAEPSVETSAGDLATADAPRALQLLPRLAPSPAPEAPAAVGLLDEAAELPRAQRVLEPVRIALAGALTEAAKTSSTLRGPGTAALAAQHTFEAKASGDHRVPPRVRVNTEVDQSVGAGDLKRNQASLLALESFVNGPSSATWTLEVETRRTAAGLELAVVRGSGHPPIDDFVRTAASTWLRGSGEAALAQYGRLLWRVKVYVHFRQSLKGMSPLDAAGLLLTAPLTGLGKGSVNAPKVPLLQRMSGLAVTFKFDETGAVEVVNLAAPQFRLEAELLEVGQAQKLAGEP